VTQLFAYDNSNAVTVFGVAGGGGDGHGGRAVTWFSRIFVLHQPGTMNESKEVTLRTEALKIYVLRSPLTRNIISSGSFIATSIMANRRQEKTPAAVS